MNLLLATVLVAAAAQPPAPPGDMRTVCTGGATVQVKTLPGKVPKSRVIGFEKKGQRIVTLPSGRILIAKDVNGEDELLLQEEGGRYRRIVKGHSKVRYLAESPDAKWVAVVVVASEAGAFEVPMGALYLFDTTAWEGREVTKNFGFTGIAWSPDSTILAYGDFAKLRFTDPLKAQTTESCVFDSQATSDSDEQLMRVGFADAKTVRLTYQNQTRSIDYVVKLP